MAFRPVKNSIPYTSDLGPNFDYNLIVPEMFKFVSLVPRTFPEGLYITFSHNYVNIVRELMFP